MGRTKTFNRRWISPCGEPIAYFKCHKYTASLPQQDMDRIVSDNFLGSVEFTQGFNVVHSVRSVI